VNFSEGTTSLGSGTLNSSGVATYSTSALGVGSDAVTAAYAGSTGFSASTSSAVTVAVTAPVGTTTTTLTASSTNVSSGSAVTFTATVAPASGTGTPTGSVEFKDGSTTIDTAQLTSGMATYTTSSLGTGSNAITAGYGGSTSFSSSTSSAVNVTVSAASTSQFCATLNEPQLMNIEPQHTCALGTTSLGVPENQNDFWGAVYGGVCSTAGWPTADLNGFSCTWPGSITVTYNEPVQSIALVQTAPTNNGSELVNCTQTGVGNIMATITNPNPNPNATGTVTITQSTSSFSNSAVPAGCLVVAFDVNGEAIVTAVGLQLSGGGPD
jgi:hypothetical protein